MRDRVAQMLRYLIERVPGVGRPQIVKLLYLADLEARRYLGRPLSTLRYVWYHHGPFDPQIQQELDRLCREGFVSELRIEYPSGGVGSQYRSTDRSFPSTFEQHEAAILDLVVETYSRQPLNGLLDDVVYQTKPMLDAIERNGYHGELRMDLVDSEARLRGLELDRVYRAVEEARHGPHLSREDLLAELRG